MKFLLICAFLFASFTVAVSLKCYKCNVDCEKNPNVNETVTCPPDKTKCFKNWIKNKAGQYLRGRGCLLDQSSCNEGQKICEKSKKEKKVEDCLIECCGSDLCNTGVLLVPGLFVSLCSAVFVVGLF